MMDSQTRTDMIPALEFSQLSFAYPEGASILREVSARVPQGAFALVTGDTGSGKTTLLRMAKREIRPEGRRSGEVRVCGNDIDSLDPQESARTVGYVFQRPENQVVCDSVWHEMAFGLENLGTAPDVMRRRIAETCSYLGMEPWFRSSVEDLSGGQHQVLALASVLVMQAKVLLLDEPTSMLDPVAERRFLALLYQLNREQGITVVVASHAPDRFAPYATMRLHLADGCLVQRDVPTAGGQAPGEVPFVPRSRASQPSAPVADLRGVWLRYSRDADWVLRGLDLRLQGGTIHALVGNNGSGKSTALSLIAGSLRAQRGRVHNSLKDSQVLLPQDPKILLSCQTVGEDLLEWAPPRLGESPSAQLAGLLDLLGLPADVVSHHPYDLSGGQQQLVALGKLLVTRPSLLLLDEPTKGLDGPSKQAVARLVSRARDEGATVVIATHDLPFVRQVADEVTLLFDGQAAVSEPVEAYFDHRWLY